MIDGERLMELLEKLNVVNPKTVYDINFPFFEKYQVEAFGSKSLTVHGQMKIRLFSRLTGRTFEVSTAVEVINPGVSFKPVARSCKYQVRRGHASDCEQFFRSPPASWSASKSSSRR